MKELNIVFSLWLLAFLYIEKPYYVESIHHLNLNFVVAIQIEGVLTLQPFWIYESISDQL